MATLPPAYARVEESTGVRMSPDLEQSANLFDFDDTRYMLYNPHSLREQMEVAAHHLPSEIGTPAQYAKKTMDALHILEEVQSGSMMGRTKFLEAISYDDFNYIMQDVIFRKMMDKWSIPDSPFPSFSKEVKVATMQRPGKMFTLDGIETPIPLVHPGMQPTVRAPYDSGIALRPYKYMADVEILWETMIEDDLNALSDIPNRLDNAVKTSLGRIYTGLYAKSTGWRDGAGEPFNSAANDKILDPTLTNNKVVANQLAAAANFGTPSNAPLSLPAIQAARTQMAKFLSPDGNPIDIKAVHLVVGRGLEQVAKNILQSQTQVMERAGGIPGAPGNGFVRINVSTDTIAGITLHVDPYFHVIVTTGSVADTMWMMVADPNIARPLFARCVLAGYESPILQRRVPNYRSVGSSSGGNPVDWISTGFRCGFIIGTQWGDARGAIVSKGTGV